MMMEMNYGYGAPGKTNTRRGGFNWRVGGSLVVRRKKMGEGREIE
jgi:hypothetical protein